MALHQILKINNPDLWKHLIPRPQQSDHKYNRGSILIVGSCEMTGAACLATEGCRRMGAGLITIITKPQNAMVYRVYSPAYIVKEYTDNNDFNQMIQDPKYNAILIGPGMLPNEETKQLVIDILKLNKPVVLDAGAILCFKNVQELSQYSHSQVVITPHNAEFKQIFATTGSKVEQTQYAATVTGSTIVHKGAETVIASPDNVTIINDHAPASLAVGGTGDILAGMIASLIGQKIEPINAAAIATWAHGEGAYSLKQIFTPEELAVAIGNVYNSFFETYD